MYKIATLCSTPFRIFNQLDVFVDVMMLFNTFDTNSFYIHQFVKFSLDLTNILFPFRILSSNALIKLAKDCEVTLKIKQCGTCTYRLIDPE